jgi:hypothetical protein
MKVILSIILLSFSVLTYADAPITGQFAIHIAKRYYEHPVRMLHPYLDVWHMKGPALEKVAIAELPHYFSNVSMCADSHDADAVISLEPQVFYSSQLRLFYVEIFAKVYMQSMTPVTSAKAEVQQRGELAILPENAIGKAYKAALQHVMQKLQNDPSFKSISNQPGQHTAETLCPLLETLPASRIYY